MNRNPIWALLFSSVFASAAIGWVILVRPEPKPKPAKKSVTYAEDVATILNKNCVECHRPGQVAPFSLVGYENAKKWSSMTAVVTQSRRMPPWKAVPGHGEFQDEARLSPEEIETLRLWAEQKTPRGNQGQEPKAASFSSDWALGKPDLVVGESKSFRLEAEGDDVYRNFVIKTDWKEPKWVSAIDVRPGNPKIVHHVIAFLDQRGQSHKLEADTKDGQPGYPSFGGVGFVPNGSLGGWAPGLRPRFSPKGTAFRLDPGTTIVLQVHYSKTGKQEVDRTELALYLAKDKVEKEMQLAWFANPIFRIPPGEANHRVSMSRRIPTDVTMYGFMPHMHLLGKSMSATLTYPDGKKIPLIKVDNWEFKWQMMYTLKQPIKAPAGSRISIEAIYDNSLDNPSQPSNPPKPVTWGEQTKDEMFLLIAGYTIDRESARGID
jgi:mono/diheme cytochrome c family protein